MSEILFVLLLGHFIADFLLQTSSLAKKKKIKQTRQKALLKHVGTHVIVNLVITLCLWQLDKINISQVLSIVLIIAITHYVIDYLKLRFFSESNIVWWNATVYLIDQVLHIIMILITLSYLDVVKIQFGEVFNFIEQNLFTRNSFSNLDKVFLIGIILIITTHFFGFLLQIILQNIKPISNYIESKTETVTTRVYKQNEPQPSEEKTTVENTDVNHSISQPSFEIGRYIGMMERVVIMVLVATNAYTGITFLVAIKALTRFKQFDDKNFAEYYLIGSLLSLLLGMCSGFVLKYILLI